MSRKTTNPKLQLHPEAAKNFDEKANNLLLELGPRALETSNKQVKPERFISHHFTPRDIVGEIRSGLTDSEGNKVAFFFGQEGKLIGLSGESYQRLVTLSSAIQSTESFRSAVSLNLIEGVIFDWMREKYKSSTAACATDYLIAQCQNRIIEIEVWLPVAMTHLEYPIKVGKVILKPITKEDFDRWRAKIKAANSEARTAMNTLFDQEQKELQGFGASTIKLFAEPERALEIAIEESERALAMLRIFSPANFSPKQVSRCTLVGKEGLGTLRHFIVQRGEVTRIGKESTERYVRPWQLSRETVSACRVNGLTVLSRLLERKTRTSFQDSLLDSLLVYSKSSLAKPVEEKLIYILVALESILLRNKNEPILDNIAVRMAYVIRRTVSERQSVIKNVKAIYELRSAFIHHGQSIGDIQILREFMAYAWEFFICMIQNANVFAAQQDLVNTIEKGRLSGSIH